jgi:hypothetical protein
VSCGVERPYRPYTTLCSNTVINPITLFSNDGFRDLLGSIFIRETPADKNVSVRFVSIGFGELSNQPSIVQSSTLPRSHVTTTPVAVVRVA